MHHRFPEDIIEKWYVTALQDSLYVFVIVFAFELGYEIPYRVFCDEGCLLCKIDKASTETPSRGRRIGSLSESSECGQP